VSDTPIYFAEGKRINSPLRTMRVISFLIIDDTICWHERSRGKIVSYTVPFTPDEATQFAKWNRFVKKDETKIRKAVESLIKYVRRFQPHRMETSGDAHNDTTQNERQGEISGQ
jgi:hypothetical protein